MRTHNLLPIIRPPSRIAVVGIWLSIVSGTLGGCVAMNDHPPAVMPPPGGTSAPASLERRHSFASASPGKYSAEKPFAKTNTVEMRASVDPKSLVGLDPDSVLKRLGTPARIENGPLSREWIYASSGCSFRVFFYPDMNSTSFKVLKYGSLKDNGEAAGNSDICVHRILTARKNDTNN